MKLLARRSDPFFGTIAEHGGHWSAQPEGYARSFVACVEHSNAKLQNACRNSRAYSLDLKLFAYIRTRDWLDYMAIREDINLRVIEIVSEAGTGFAFASQTAYLGRASGLDVERGQEAENAVQEWRSRGELPFPEFDEQRMREKQDALDYPPLGSPNYKPREDHGS